YSGWHQQRKTVRAILPHTALSAPSSTPSPDSVRHPCELHKASEAQHSATQPAQAPVLARKRGDTQAGTVRGRAQLQGCVGPSQSCSCIQSSGGRVPCVY
nr:hypothetical protein [Tanacetum cinerariifolium]